MGRKGELEYIVVYGGPGRAGQWAQVEQHDEQEHHRLDMRCRLAHRLQKNSNTRIVWIVGEKCEWNGSGCFCYFRYILSCCRSRRWSSVVKCAPSTSNSMYLYSESEQRIMHLAQKNRKWNWTQSSGWEALRSRSILNTCIYNSCSRTVKDGMCRFATKDFPVCVAEQSAQCFCP